MKQGPSNSARGDGYRTPIARGVNPGWADQLGQAMAKRAAVTPMYDGKQGITCPPSKNYVHPCGSQGKHK